MYTTSIAVQVLPDVTETEKVLAIVDKVIAYIDSTGYHYVVGPFETTIEGDRSVLLCGRKQYGRFGRARAH